MKKLIIILSLFSLLAFDFAIYIAPVSSQVKSTLLDSKDEKENKVFNKLKNKLSELDKKTSSNNPIDTIGFSINKNKQAFFKQNVIRSIENIDTLNGIKESSEQSIPPEYLKDIEDNTDLIEEVLLKGEIGNRELEKIKSVQDDTEIKVNYAESRPEGPFDSVNVAIVTKINGIAKGQYKVWYVPEKHKNNKSKYDTFDKFSDSKTGITSKQIPPSKYQFWTETVNQTNVFGDKETKTVNDKSASAEFDLEAKN